MTEVINLCTLAPNPWWTSQVATELLSQRTIEFSKLYSSEKFQIQLPLDGIGIILRADWALTR
jgi:hypothetical protein